MWWQIQGAYSTNNNPRAQNKFCLCSEKLTLDSSKMHIGKECFGKMRWSRSFSASGISGCIYGCAVFDQIQGQSSRQLGDFRALVHTAKISGLRTSWYPWSPGRIYGLLWRGRWEPSDPTTAKSWRPLSKQPALPEHLSRASARWVPCRAALLQSLMQEEPRPNILLLTPTFVFVLVCLTRYCNL